MKTDREKMTIPIINQIEETVKNVPGWSPIDQLYTLFNIVFMTSGLEGDIVEIGSWCGRSAIVLGMAVRLTGNANIHCIDLFPEKNDWRQNEDGSYSFEVTVGDKRYGGYKEQTVWKEPFERDIAPIYEKYNGIFDVFSQIISINGLADIVRTYKGDSDLFVRSLPEDFKSKLVFIDGDHSYEAVCQDIKNMEKYLINGGWVCFDDAFSYYDGVNRAIKDCIINSPNYELCQQMARKFFVARKKR